MHKTLYNIPGGKCPQNISFFRRGCLCSSKEAGGTCAMAQWHYGQSKSGERAHITAILFAFPRTSTTQRSEIFPRSITEVCPADIAAVTDEWE